MTEPFPHSFGPFGDPPLPDFFTVRNDVHNALVTFGYAPTDDTTPVSTDVQKTRSAVARLTDPTETPQSLDEVRWAVLEAVAIRGGVLADLESIEAAAQLVWARHQRAARDEIELANVRARLQKGLSHR